MAKAPVKIYDKSLTPVADLEAAKNISYTMQANQVSKASFDLPADNEKNDRIEGRFFAEIFDNGERLGMFRINKKTPENKGDSADITYTCKHALDTLNDKRIQSTVEKTSETTALQYLIDQQETVHWQLGDVEFSKGYTYEFKRQSLLEAFLSVPGPWWEEYQLEFDTTSHPWTVHVRKPNTTPQATLQYHKNLKTISQTVDWEPLVTRLYAYGSGSGEDQVEAGPFEQNVGTWGVVEREFEDQFFDNATDLEDAALKFLDRASNPRVDYDGNAADFYTLFGTNKIELGDYVTVYDSTLGIDVKAKVVQLKKQSVLGQPGNIQLSLNNRRKIKPDWGVLAFKDEAKEDELAPNSVRGGTGGALAGGTVASGNLGAGSVDEAALADAAVTWNKVGFKDGSGNYVEQTRLKIDSFVTFESNFTDVDKLEDGTTYAKMRKEWRSGSDITMIDGGQIYTDSVTLDKVLFSPVLSDEVVASINASEEGITINAGKLSIDTKGLQVDAEDQIALKTSGRMQFDASNQLDIYGPNILISALNPDGAKQAVNDDSETVTIEGKNIELNGNTTVQGTFQVSQGNVLIDQDLVLDEDGTVQQVIGASVVGLDSTNSWNFEGTGINANTIIHAGLGIDMFDTEINNLSSAGGVTTNAANFGDVIDEASAQISSHQSDSDAHHSKTPEYTDEMAQDAVGNNVGPDLTYDDGAGEIDVSVPYITVAGNTVYLGASTSIDIGDLTTNSDLDMGYNNIYNVGGSGHNLGNWSEKSTEYVEDLTVSMKDVKLADGTTYSCLLIDSWTTGGTMYYIGH